MKTRHIADTLAVEGLCLAADSPPLSFSLTAGECLALLFLNDTRSTLSLLADTLAGHRHAVAGRLMMADQDITRRRPGHRAIATVGARDPLFDHLSVRENVAFPLRARKRPSEEISHRVSQTLALLGLERLVEARPSRLTAAERIRVALARALATDPAVIVLEDAFTGLDSETRRDLHQRLFRLQRAQDLSLLLLTRDRADALAAGQRIGVLEAGTLLQLGVANDLIERPASARVAVAMADANVLVGMALSIDDDIVRARLACGGEMEALAETGVEENEVIDLCIRPNQIAPMMQRGPHTDDNDGFLSATLTDVRNVGDLLILRFRLEDGMEVTVHRPPGTLPPGTAPGQAALLAWRPTGALAFPSVGKQG
ncbi:ABC transporter ATP-binding protein [Acetobacter conturbans]|uniref:ATP-binding cassette domain-containing protein n=1 Tax=Acetobacter conturbans TaxID=1737472 RepID=A0ABX0K3B8_9PROT|nr:ABC transporter ATP-binding protein [Acetobacter conturbans]NHN89301.1 ATP-binding cassette domain-containing protein [Acetobacter conturbans]